MQVSKNGDRVLIDCSKAELVVLISAMLTFGGDEETAMSFSWSPEQGFKEEAVKIRGEGSLIAELNKGQ